MSNPSHWLEEDSVAVQLCCCSYPFSALAITAFAKVLDSIFDGATFFSTNLLFGPTFSCVCDLLKSPRSTCTRVYHLFATIYLLPLQNWSRVAPLSIIIVIIIIIII